MIHKSVMDSVSLEFSSLARSRAMSGEKIYSLGLGEPFWDVPEIATRKLSQLAINQKFGYSSPFGNNDLRRFIADDIVGVSGYALRDYNILIAAGAKQALTIVLKTILEDSDEVIIIDPCFVSYGPQVLLANHNSKAIFCPLSRDFSIDFEELSARISRRTKVILINSPNNPSGAVISKREMERLVSLAKDCGAYLVCDEIYRDFVFGDQLFHSANSHRNSYSKIITIDGFSKTYAMTGWRLGYIVASQEFIARAVKVVQHEITNVPEILQIAACEVFSLPDRWFEQYRSIIENNSVYYAAAINDLPMISTPPLRGGMFCFPKIDINNLGSDQIAVELLKKESVAVTPGIAFGESWDKHLRVSLSMYEHEFRNAIDKFANFFRSV